MEGDVLPPPTSYKELQRALDQADAAAWDGDRPDSLDLDVLYEDWLLRLQRWLPQLTRPMGELRTRRKLDTMDAKAPLHPRQFWRANIARKLHHKLIELSTLHARLWPEDRVPFRVCQLYKYAQKAPWAAWEVSPPLIPLGHLPDYEDVATLLDWMAREWQVVYNRVTESSAHSLRQWRLALQDSIVTGKVKLLGHWLKGRQRLPLLATDDAMYSHPQQVGEELRRAWLPIFCPGDAAYMSDETITYMTELIAPHPWCPGPIDHQALQSFAQSRSPSAPGLDGIQLLALQHLPSAAWSYLAFILNLIEATGQWPSSLLEVSLCAIPKGEAAMASPLKYRLIGVTSHVYRLWSGFRAMQTNKGWIAHLIGDCNFGGIPKRSAKQASLLDALSWEEAHFSDSPYFAAYVDASKCFDTLRYSDLIKVSRALGLSERVLVPLEQWYLHHRRHITVGGWKQAGFTPERGIPQGCPLSVTMAIVWSLTWSARAVDLLASPAPDQWSCVTYLDDYSFGSSSLVRLQRCLGWTQEHFRRWGVCLNLDKSSLVTNRSGHQQEEGMRLLDTEEYSLLGIQTGWSFGSAPLQDRLAKVRNLTTRAMLLQLPQGHFQKLASIFLQPLLYGLEFCDEVPFLEQYDRSLRIPMWGRARVAGNWNAIVALDLPSHSCTAMGTRFQRAFSTIWMGSSLPSLRAKLMSLWNSIRIPRPGGIWSVFLSLLHSAQLRLDPGGGVKLMVNDMPIMHLNMPKSAWMHQARLAWRMQHILQAARRLPLVYPVMVHVIDWQLTIRPAGQRSPMLSTFQCNAINSCFRSHYHFAVACSPLCEHQCGEPDDGEHRMLRCHALVPMRRALHIEDGDLEYLAQLHHCHRRAAIWLYPLDYIPWRLSQDLSWRLWPTQEWLAQVNALSLQEAPIRMEVIYITHIQGRHPELRRHAMAVLWDELDIDDLSAMATMSMTTRMQWESDVLMLAAIVALRCNQMVFISGLHASLERLWCHLDAQKGSNLHLLPVLQSGRSRVQVQLGPCHEHLLLKNQLRDALDVPVQAARLLERNVVLARKVALLIDHMGDSHPLAATISRHHGDLRGGCFSCCASGVDLLLPSWGSSAAILSFLGFCLDSPVLGPPGCSFAGFGAPSLSHPYSLFLTLDFGVVVQQQLLPATATA